MLNYDSYKGRKINFDQKVMVYKNLHNGKFSVKQNGLVVAHVDSIEFEVAMFNVNESGRQRVINEKKKNVHAFIVGYIKAVNVDKDVSNLKAVSYNPYKYSQFYFKSNSQLVSPMSYDNVFCSISKGVYVA